MSTDLIVREEHGYKLTQFFGGTERGKMVQITPLGAGDLPADTFPLPVQLTPGALEQLARDILNLGDTPTPEEMATALTELGADRDQLYKEAEEARAELEDQKRAAKELFDEAKRAQREAAEAREEARAAATDRRKERERAEVLEKELDHAREEKARAERDLSRALGYIDRVVESEPPVTDPIAVVNRHCGDVGESFVSGPQRRGPVLDNPWRS